MTSFEEGAIQDYKETNQIPRANLFYWNAAFYATDDWKITPRFSLTFGLRAEHITQWTDKHGVGASIFNPSTIASSASASLPLPGFTWHGLDKSQPMAGFDTRALFYEPRIGFAWDIYGNGKTTLCGGYGQYRFHDGWFDAQQTTGTAAGLRTATLQNRGVNPRDNSTAPGGANGMTLGALRDPVTIQGGFTLPNGVRPTPQARPSSRSMARTIRRRSPKPTARRGRSSFRSRASLRSATPATGHNISSTTAAISPLWSTTSMPSN